MKHLFRTEPLAIIGAACRFPGNVSDMPGFWRLLSSGEDAVTTLPPDRCSQERFFSKAPDMPGHAYTGAAGVLSSVKEFDAEFFGLSRKEAMDMDPQQRLLLEMTWEAMEAACLPPSALRGSNTGVFVGASSMDYTVRGVCDPENLTPYSMTGSSLSVLANRISYLFDLHGPSLVTDTACSSSLVALHAACQALLRKDIPLAVVGGINVFLSPLPFIGFSKARMLSPDGRCKVFDASGNGYVRSEGGGVVLVKPLRQARKDHDPILAVIAGAGVNSDGRTTGLALPNAGAQSALLRDIYDGIGLDKNKLAYVEAHGTGTAAGDPLEALAIGEVLGKALRGVRSLPVGSVKSNIGHLEPAAGMAGLLKAILVLQHGKIPATLHFHTPNPAIDFADLNLTVPTRLVPLSVHCQGTLVGVNSFGFGGTNAHVVLEKAPRTGRTALSGAAQEALPLFLSGRSEKSLRAKALALSEYLEGASPALCRETAATLACCRDHLRFRAVIPAAGAEPLSRRLQKFGAGVSGKGKDANEGLGENCPGAFVFSGNGSQWLGMGTDFLKKNAVFAAAVEEVDSLLSSLRKGSLLDALRNPGGHPRSISHTEESQPLLFALQVGLVNALKDKGIVPQAVFGHSVGEVAAAWTAGALSLKDACTIIHYRSLLQSRFRDVGHMAVARLSEAEACRRLEPCQGKIEITAVNSADSLTLGGEATALADCVRQWKKDGITAKLLDLPYPFHSHYMDEVREEFLEALKDIRPGLPRLPFFSTAGGGTEAGRKLDAAYWWRNMRSVVRFQDAALAALEHGCRIFLEIGPRPVLAGYLQDCVSRSGLAASVLGTLQEKGADAENFEKSWQSAWQKGWALCSGQLARAPFARRVLPPYPWNREHLWLEDSPECRDSFIAPRLHPLLGWRLPLAAPGFENTLHIADYSWLADHRAGDSVPFPAACFVEMFLAAAAALCPGERKELERLTLFRPLRLRADAGKRLRVLADGEDGVLRLDGRGYMRSEEWNVYARARMIPARRTRPADFLLADPDEFGAPVAGEELYAVARQHHLSYGPAFRRVEKAWIRQGSDGPEALARLVPPVEESSRGMLIPPTLLDGAFQTLFLLLRFRREDKAGQAWLPASFGQIALFAEDRPVFSHVRLRRVGRRSVLADVSLLDKDGRVVTVLEGCRFRRASWLEGAPSAGYVMRSVPAPRQDAASPPDIGLEDIALFAGRAGNAPAPREASRQAMSPRALLRFTALKYAHEALVDLARKNSMPDAFSLADLRDSGLLAKNREVWLRHMLLRLSQADLARQTGETWELLHPAGIPAAEMLWRTAVGTSPGHLPEAVLLARIPARLQKLLADDRQTPALPPSLFTNYLAASPDLRVPHQALAQCLDNALRSRSAGRSLRILQIAFNARDCAGRMLPLLAGSDCLYEIAVAEENEVAALEKGLSAAPEARVIHLDLEKKLPRQAGRYHVILASFFLHSLDNVALAVENCHSLLAPGGVLCLLEHQPTSFTDFTFGALPDWWKESAPDSAPTPRFHSLQNWTKILEQSGFAAIREFEGEQREFSPGFLLLAGKSEEELPVVSRPPQNGLPRLLILAREKNSDAGNLGQALQEALCASGREASVLHAGDALPRGGVFDPLSGEHWRALLTSHALEGPVEVVSLLGYDRRNCLAAPEFSEIMDYGLTATAAFASAWETLRCGATLRLVTGGAVEAGDGGSAPVPSQGAFWGFGRVLMNELAGLETRLLDVHGDVPDIEALARELLAPSEDREIVLAGGARWTPRLVPIEQERSGSGPGNVRLVFDTPGRLQNLYWRGAEPELPGPGQVRVAVKAVGLNFRDVMWSMGLLPEEALENGFSGPGLGMECAGVIEAVGEGVTALKAGDAVMAFAPSCFQSLAVTNAGAVALKPGGMSFAEAATIPVAFLTAWYSIKHLAAAQAGERILIHGAAGGVGLAAIQIANHLGLEVYATVGSEEKRAFLRKLGVKHLFSSRSLAFAQEIMEATRGQGVDVVLNSLAGEAIAAGISVLKPFGRFLELGKRDVYADSPLRMRPFSKNLSFHGIDVDQLFAGKPGLASTLLQELMGLVVEGRLRPLPHISYPRVQAVDAFQAMQQSSHIGKLVILMDEAAIGVRPQPAAMRSMSARGDAAYLVSGGTDGFGLATAALLAERGAGHLLLLSRNGVKTPEAQAVIESMRGKNTRVSILKADVADQDALSRVLKAALTDDRPLAGVIHAAAVLDDGMITGLSRERIHKVLAAKAVGAWNLHRATLDAPLDFFILYSSATTAFGNPGQANYVAANGVLESLAALRRHKGLPATVIGWGPIADAGMLQRNPRAGFVLKNLLGVSDLFSREALAWLELCLANDIPASHYFGLDWQRQTGLAAFDSTRFERLVRRNKAKVEADVVPLERIRSCSREEGLKTLTEMLRAEIADILCMAPERLAPDAPIADEGMDSLMAMELGLAIDQKFELDGYTVSLNEKISTADIAKILYPVIMSKGDNNAAGMDNDLLLVDSLSRQHALDLPEEMKRDLSLMLHGEKNE